MDLLQEVTRASVEAGEDGSSWVKGLEAIVFSSGNRAYKSLSEANTSRPSRKASSWDQTANKGQEEAEDKSWHLSAWGDAQCQLSLS